MDGFFLPGKADEEIRTLDPLLGKRCSTTELHPHMGDWGVTLPPVDHAASRAPWSILR